MKKMSKTRLFKWVLLLMICLTQAGCLGPLGQLISLPFQLLGKTLDVVGKLPLPPPGVF